MMGPGYFVIAILGCADGGTACTPVATLQTRYESAAQCDAATVSALEANSNFDFPTLLAKCRAGSAANAASISAPERKPADARPS
jgi:acyl-CoA synthetase (AMP-forming)/AMP-acid ligase II